MTPAAPSTVALSPPVDATAAGSPPPPRADPAPPQTSPQPSPRAPQPAPPPPAGPSEYNRTGLNFRRPMPRPKVKGLVIDAHCHLFAARHAKVWFEAARVYGIDAFLTMTPLEEAVHLQRDYPGRLQFIAIPQWQSDSVYWMDDWLRRIEAFYNIGSRVVKFHMAPGTMMARKWHLQSPEIRRLLQETVDRNMLLMSHVGDPDTWYNGKYAADPAYGTRTQHYAAWEAVLTGYKHRPWLGAHLGGHPEDPAHLQRLLDTYPNLYLDLSATRWMVREVSNHRDAVREFILRNPDRLLWGSDQVSGDGRNFDFLASRFWCHRKLWETAYIGPSPILDPDCPPDAQPTLRGLALPDEILQKIMHDNATSLLGRFGVRFGDV